MSLRKKRVSGSSGKGRGLNVTQTGQDAAESTKEEIKNLHCQIEQRLRTSMHSMEEAQSEREVNETCFQRLKVLYDLERRMEFFISRTERRTIELIGREFDESDYPVLRDVRPKPSGHSNPEIPPIPLITTSGGRLVLNQEALQKLRRVQGRIGVLGMAGTYRTGKSFILSRIMGEQGGFPIDSKVRSCTRGIWMWGKHIEGTPNIDYLLVLDTEGLRDPMKGDKKHDTSIFALAMLLSSYLVYNAMNVIDFSAIRDLHLVANLHEHIRCRVQQDERRVIPRFCWLVRDFALSLEIDGRPCSEGEYLENALMLRGDGDPQANDIKRYLREMFPDRDCVCLCKPTEDDSILRKLDEQPYESLRHEFTNKLNLFINQIYTNIKPLTVMGQLLTGSMFGTLSEEYVKAINSGAVPDISDTFRSLAMIECQRALKEACNIYRTKMDQEIDRTGLPMDLSDLSNLHNLYETEARTLFETACIGDKDGTYRRQLQDAIAEYSCGDNGSHEQSTRLIGGMYFDYTQRNEVESTRACEELLRMLYIHIQEKLVGQQYFPPKGSVDDFFQDQIEIKNLYNETQGKGPKANQVLCDFFEGQTDTQLLLKFTEILSEADKKLVSERQKQSQLHLQHLKNEENIKKMQTDRVNQKRAHLVQLQAIHDENELVKQQRQREYDNKITLRLLEVERLGVEQMNRASEQMRRELTLLSQKYKDEEDRQNQKLNSVRREINESQQEINRLNSLPNRQEHGGGGGGGSCFSAWSYIRVRNQDTKATILKQLWELAVGDEVESVDPLTGEKMFSTVYFIVHDEERGAAGQDLLKIEFKSEQKSGSITLHSSHLIYVSDKEEEVLTRVLQHNPVQASQVIPGQYVWITTQDKLQQALVTSVHVVSGIPVRHPMTLNHYIIVDNVIASVHMFNEKLYRAITSPLRGLFAVSPQLCSNKFVKKIVALWDLAENWLPLTF